MTAAQRRNEMAKTLVRSRLQATLKRIGELEAAKFFGNFVRADELEQKIADAIALKAALA